MWEILSVCFTTLILVRLIPFCSSHWDSSSDGLSKKTFVVSAPLKKKTVDKTWPSPALKNDLKWSPYATTSVQLSENVKPKETV
jgi:hypothetical protein